jgi:hypothetical protein
MTDEKVEKRDIAQKKRANIFWALALVAILVVAFSGLWILSQTVMQSHEVDPPDDEITVSLSIICGSWEIHCQDVRTRNNTVFTLLLECSKDRDFELSYDLWPGYNAVFISAINGTDNGEGSMWWQYYVNGVYGEVACDKKEIFQEDHVEWRFEEPGQ